MNPRSKWKRYVVAVYLLLLATSIILSLIGLNYYDSDTPMQSLFLNLSTELTGAVLIFFVVDQIFQLGESDHKEDIAKKIDGLRKEIHQKFSPLVSKNYAESTLNFGKMLLECDSIDIMGYTRNTTLRQHRRAFEQAIQYGTSIRVIVIDVESDAGNLLKQNSNNVARTEQYFSATIDYATEIHQTTQTQNSGGQFEVRVINWIPSYSLSIFYPRLDSVNKMEVKINSPSYRAHRVGGRVRLLLDSQEHSREFLYFVNHFEKLWEHEAKPLVFGEMQDQKNEH